MDDHSSDRAVTDTATAANPDLLEHKRLRCPARRQTQHAVPIWRCSWWGLPCRRCCQQRGGLLPHRFTLTRRQSTARCTMTGGLFSVALSVGLPRPGVTRHHSLSESGLSSKRARLGGRVRRAVSLSKIKITRAHHVPQNQTHPAAIQPSAHPALMRKRPARSMIIALRRC